MANPFNIFLFILMLITLSGNLLAEDRRDLNINSGSTTIGGSAEQQGKAAKEIAIADDLEKQAKEQDAICAS